MHREVWVRVVEDAEVFVADGGDGGDDIVAASVEDDVGWIGALVVVGRAERRDRRGAVVVGLHLVEDVLGDRAAHTQRRGLVAGFAGFDDAVAADGGFTFAFAFAFAFSFSFSFSFSFAFSFSFSLAFPFFAFAFSFFAFSFFAFSFFALAFAFADDDADGLAALL